MVDQYQWWQPAIARRIHVMLGNKGVEDLLDARPFRVLREERAITEVVSTADDEKLHTASRRVARGRDDIAVATVILRNVLPLLHTFESGDLIPVTRRQFELEPLRCTLHARNQRIDHRRPFALEEHRRMFDIVTISCCRN